VGAAEILQFVIGGLKSGAIYALVALGFTIVYASTGAINFAQGEFFMLGGMFAAYLSARGLPVLLAAVAAIALTTVIGVVFELLAIRPIKGGDPLKIIMVTIGGSVLMRQFALHAFGPDEIPVPAFTEGSSIRFLGAAVERQTVWLWALAILALAVLAWVYGKSRFGRAMRATALQRDAARLVGVDASLMVTASFGMAAALGALAGVAVAPLTQAAFGVGSAVGVKGFAAAILGGLGNPAAAVGGGLVLGLLESLTAGLTNPTYKDAAALVVLLVVLFVRPQGLFGRAGREKV
jgi:branched-chain amino acid transport system permease protein